MDFIGEYHGLRVGSALLSIVAGCIIIGVSKDCDADAVGGIFLGAGGLGLLISVYPFIRAWFNFHHILPNIGNFRVHPMATNSNPAPEQPAATLTREGKWLFHMDAHTHTNPSASSLTTED
uniref:Kinocilin n=1 Tax=Cyprinus carpio TaxID=7962 RepID=A0A8C1G4M9_CYPCA